jgi:hypothetical protein
MSCMSVEEKYEWNLLINMKFIMRDADCETAIDDEVPVFETRDGKFMKF